MNEMNRAVTIFGSILTVICVMGCASVESSGTDNAIQKIKLSEKDAVAIGRKIWQNECSGTIEGLTSWNKGEDFPSLGIGHFIWYVKGRPGPFEESFPRLISFMKKKGVAVPAWISETGGSPWTARSQFYAEQNSTRMKELRTFLANTVNHQTAFIVHRLETSLPKMKAATPDPRERQRLEANFYAVANTRAGLYSLIDYVNFKGEGIKASESYRGQGWGLRNVLLEMQPSGRPANFDFSEAAKRVLQRRVKNSPPSRGESRWLGGWMNRCEGYKKGI